MARKLRLQYPGAIYHVMNRGDRQKPIFEDDADRERFLETMAEACLKTGWQVHAYCLMGEDRAAVATRNDGQQTMDCESIVDGDGDQCDVLPEARQETMILSITRPDPFVFDLFLGASFGAACRRRTFPQDLRARQTASLAPNWTRGDDAVSAARIEFVGQQKRPTDGMIHVQIAVLTQPATYHEARHLSRA